MKSPVIPGDALRYGLVIAPVGTHTSKTMMLADTESFVVRRYFCGIPTNRLNRIFVAAYRNTEPPQGGTANQRIGTLRQYFDAQDWPDDARFKMGF